MLNLVRDDNTHMKIHTYPLGQMRANCYLLEQDGKALVIDPGDSADFILEQIQSKNLDLVGIVATHGHFDHIMAVGEMQLSYPDIPLYIHPKDEFLLKRVGETAQYFLGYDPVVVPIGSTKVLKAGSFRISIFEFRVLYAPGHTPGSCSFYFGKDTVLFSGDTLFKAGIGRYDFSYSNKEDLKSSIGTLLQLSPDTIVSPGHGLKTTINEEKNIITHFF